MKKILLILAVFIVSTTVLISCGTTTPSISSIESTTSTIRNHVHILWSDWEVIKKPTTTEEGLETRYCSCGEKQERVIPVLSPNERLEFEINSDGQGYSVVGIGDCLDKYILIPDTYEGLPVTNIAAYAFDNCVDIESIYVPDSVISIREYAFKNCDSLETVEIADSVLTIGEGVFYSCDSLYSIVLSNLLTSIDDYTFYNCTSLASIELPDSVVSIGNYALIGCTLLTNMELPDSVISIGDYAFASCSSLTNILISNSVEVIGFGAFLGCSNLIAIEVNENNEYYISIDGNLYNKDKTTLVMYAIGKDDASFTIPEFVECIGAESFHGCRSLTSVVIPNSVTNIGYQAFYRCESLESIIIPDSVTSIGGAAFGYCTSLIIYCEAASLPSGWSLGWDIDFESDVVWGYTIE